MDLMDAIFAALRKLGLNHMQIIVCDHKSNYTAVALKFIVKDQVLAEMESSTSPKAAS